MSRNFYKAFLLLSVLSRLVGCNPAWAENPPEGAIPLSIDFTKIGGYFDFFPSQLIPDNALQAAENIDLQRTGTIAPRRGWKHVFDITPGDATAQTSSNWFGVFTASTGFTWAIIKIPYGTNQIIYFPINNGVFGAFAGAIANADSRASEASGISFGSSYFLTESRSTFTHQVNERILGTSLETFPTQMPGGKMSTVHIDRLLVAGANDVGTVANANTFPNRIFYSSANAPTLFSIANTIDITGTKNNEYITSLGPPLLGLLPIGTNTSFRIMSGTQFPTPALAGNISVRTISENIGVLHNRTVKNMNNKQYFLSKGENGQNPGIYRFNGVGIQEVTKGQRRFFQDYVDMSTSPVPNAFVDGENYCVNVATKAGQIPASRRNRNQQSYTVCVDEDDRVTIEFRSNFVDSSSQTGRLGFDAVDLASTTLYAISASTNVSSAGGGATEYSIYRIRTENGGDDLNDGSPASGEGYLSQPVKWRIKTKDYDMGNKAKPKFPERAYVSFKNYASTFAVTANYDYGLSSTTWVINSSTVYKYAPIVTVSSSTDRMTNKLLFPQGKVFNYINFEIYGSSLAQIDTFDFYALPQPMR